jgi:hypothetical protein
MKPVTSTKSEPMKPDLKKVRVDIRRGDLGQARERLHGLLSSYPDNLDLRKRLGEVYWSLQMPAMAGRYWYLVEKKDERMVKSCQAFEKTCKLDPAHILLAVKFRGEVAAVKDSYARDTLTHLTQEAIKNQGWYGYYIKRRKDKSRPMNVENSKDNLVSKSLPWILLAFVIIGLIFSCIGLISVVRWIF